MRRVNQPFAMPAEQGLVYPLADNRIVVDPEQQTVTTDGRPLEHVAPMEFDILATLASKPDNVFTWQTMSRVILGYEDDSHTRSSLRTQTVRLRKKLGPELGNCREGAIRARPGLGYYAVSSLAGSVEISDQPETTVRRRVDNRLHLHLDKWIVTVDGKMLNITPTQYRILNVLTREADIPVHMSVLCKELWGEDNAARRATARAQLRFIRQELGNELGDKGQGALRTKFKKGYFVPSSLC